MTLIAAQSISRARIEVDASRVIGDVSPFILGQNLEAGDPLYIFSPVSDPTAGRTGNGVWNPGSANPVPEILGFNRTLNVRMLRFPGGCLAHSFDWKKTIGPVGDRPNYTFGLDEFLSLCRQTDAEPLITVSDYTGQPSDAADLVAYLNAPVESGSSWAALRAHNGHPAPYAVRYFEMGNETDHGNHDMQPSQQWSAAEYAIWFNECAGRMRAVDPLIRLGALMGTGTGPGDRWNKTVLEQAGSNADFIIVHTYAVGLWGQTELPGERLMRACMASGEQFERMLADYNRLILQTTGRAIPLAITEYNALFVQETPVPLRFSFGAALFSADFLRILLKPELNILAANYWQYVNGYWGFLRGPSGQTAGNQSGNADAWKRLPAFYLFRLWGQHFGECLLSTQVDSPGLAFEGALGTRPARPDFHGGPVSYVPTGGSAKGVVWTAEPSRVTLSLQEFTGDSYPLLARLTPVVGGGTYRVEFEGRVVGPVPSGALVGVGFVDQRGWDATHSGSAMHGMETAGAWTTFSGGDLTTLEDCPGLLLVARLIGFKAPCTATIEIRNLAVTRLDDFPPYQVVTATASLSRDGSRIYLVIFNKHHVEPIEADIEVTGRRVRTGRLWEVTGPDLQETNLGSEGVRETRAAEVVKMPASGPLVLALSPRSMTVLELALTNEPRRRRPDEGQPR